MANYGFVPTPKKEFDEYDTNVALMTLGMYGRQHGEISPAVIASIVDLVGISHGVEFEGRRRAKVALRAMLGTEIAQLSVEEAAESIPIPTPVLSFERNVALYGTIAACNILFEEINKS
jgi:hypothetical protein